MSLQEQDEVKEFKRREGIQQKKGAGRHPLHPDMPGLSRLPKNKLKELVVIFQAQGHLSKFPEVTVDEMKILKLQFFCSTSPQAIAARS